MGPGPFLASQPIMNHLDFSKNTLPYEVTVPFPLCFPLPVCPSPSLHSLHRNLLINIYFSGSRTVTSALKLSWHTTPRPTPLGRADHPRLCIISTPSTIHCCAECLGCRCLFTASLHCSGVSQTKVDTVFWSSLTSTPSTALARIRGFIIEWMDEAMKDEGGGKKYSVDSVSTEVNSWKIKGHQGEKRAEAVCRKTKEWQPPQLIPKRQVHRTWSW